MRSNNVIVTEWRYRVDYPKKTFPERKAMDKFYRTNIKSYTGMAGKGSFFCFNSKNDRLLFVGELARLLNEQNNSYQFFKDWGGIK